MTHKIAVLDPNIGKKPEQIVKREVQPQLDIPVLGALTCRRSANGQPNVALHYQGAKDQAGNQVAVPIEAYQAAQEAFNNVLKGKGLEAFDIFGTFIPYQGIAYGPNNTIRSGGNVRMFGIIKRAMAANGFQMQTADAPASSEAGTGDDPTPDAAI